MIVTLSIAGSVLPVAQVTLRRSAMAAELSLQLAGPHNLSVGDAVLLNAGGVVINGTVTDSTPGARLTTATADVPTSTGAGVYAPGRIQFRSSGTVRGDLDFSILPGDTHAGLPIVELTHTIGSRSAAFTEVRF